MKPTDSQEKPVFTLITGGSVYAPDKLGRKDILIAGRVIARIAERIDLPAEFKPRVIRAKGKTIVPGLVDLHVHLLGGGGEAGPWSRTPEITLSKITRAGVTTVVGLLGTDDVSRRPETLLAKAMQLEQEGISAYIYSGSYQLPLATITGSLRKDIALIPKVVGVGEVAVSDHRSSQPSFEELCRIAAEARVGGMLGGKAGLVHLHMGAGSRRLDPVIRMVKETEIPIGQFLPTHLNRTRTLMEHAIDSPRWAATSTSPPPARTCTSTPRALKLSGWHWMPAYRSTRSRSARIPTGPCRSSTKKATWSSSGWATSSACLTTGSCS